MRHPSDVLFSGEKLFPILPVVDHYAGSEKLMNKAIQLQNDLGPVFDVTCDCEDGAHAGAEREHAEMAAHVIMSDTNRFGRVGARIHDITHPNWQQDLDILVSIAGARLPFITLPKPRSAADVRTQISALREAEVRAGLKHQIPVHVLIETFGALREAWEIAALPSVESLDFGLMDFVSGHHGAVPGSAMKSGAIRASTCSPREMRDFDRCTRQRCRAHAQCDNRTQGYRGHPKRCATGARRVRLSQNVEHSPEPDHADCGSDAA